nr:GNAT family N-acetyltransferase [Rhodoblastus acidophilus]
METAVLVRLREDRDDTAIFALVNENSFRRDASHFDTFPTVDALRGWLASLGESRFETVAELDNEVIGFCGLYIHPHRRSHAAWLFLGVREKFQGKGVGKKLLRTAIAAADVLFGLGRLELTVFVDNERAIGLYQTFGFEIEGRHNKFVHRCGEPVDAFSMARLHVEAGPPGSIDELRERIAKLALWLHSRRSGADPQITP